MVPLSRLVPKPLCPVANVALVDGALERVDAAVAANRPRSSPASPETYLAVNVCHGRAALIPHLEGRAHISVAALLLARTRHHRLHRAATS